MNCQVIIVGAGIAGLAAAKTLVDNGLQDIIILEGEQNISNLLKFNVIILSKEYFQKISPQNILCIFFLTCVAFFHDFNLLYIITVCSKIQPLGKTTDNIIIDIF
jgi:choline dehydrogenase-like flavoprotein